MSEVLFYHLQAQPLEAVLPNLLERCLAQSWRVVVQTGMREKLDALDAMLWTYREESFLPHGFAKDEGGSDHPIILCDDTHNPAAAEVLFLLDGAPVPQISGYKRVVLIFDGNDESAIKKARAVWSQLRGGLHQLTYWQQNEAGRWEKKG